MIQPLHWISYTYAFTYKDFRTFLINNKEKNLGNSRSFMTLLTL